jgi:ubiquinol-cytochrome c reductase cytochrome b subunit
MRQMHHWACDIFVGAIVVHMARIFFTGAFRKPRETNWAIGVTLLILAIVNGFLGYSLPDDLVSGTGIRIADSIVLSIPVVGTYVSFLLFGGNFPGTIILERFYILHVLVIPLILLGLVGAHLGLMYRQKHTQFPGPGRTEKNVVGSPMFPIFMAKTTGFMLMISGAIALLAAFFQINPIWQFGPYEEVTRISYAVQPDWCMGWLDGALRVMPSWEFTGFGHTIPFEVLIPAIIFPGIVFNIALAWPAIEARFTKDRASHNLLDRPRDRPFRTAFGVGFITLLFAMFVASATDVIANYFKISLNEVLVAMRIIVGVSPFIGFVLAYFICKELQGVHHAGKRKVPNVVIRTAQGEYLAVEAPRSPDDHEPELEAETVPTFVTSPPMASGVPVDDGTHVRQVDR